MKVDDIKSPVSQINGVGKTLLKVLAKLNIFTVGDLLQYYPRSWEDCTKKVTLSEYSQNHKIHTVAKVIAHEWFGYGNMRTLKIIINDGTATAQLIAFNRGYLEKALPIDSIISVTGQFFVKYSALQSSSFEATKLQVENDTPLKNLMPLNTGIIPVYSLTSGLTQKTLSKIINTALNQYLFGIDDEIPQELIKSNNLISKKDALLNIHRPSSMSLLNLARKTLIYEELYLFNKTIIERAFKHRGVFPNMEISENLVQIQENTTQKLDNQSFLESLSPLQKKFLQCLPYELTEDQKKVIYQMDLEIDKGYEDRAKILRQLDNNQKLSELTPFTMNRLLQGDVGSGKTLVALFMALRVINWKGQVAFMAPTEILAHQHAQNASRMLDFLGIRVAYLTGNIKSSGRNQLLKALKQGEVDIIIGTHALFSTNVIYKDLQMVVIDEQHKFGVMQRQAIVAKGRNVQTNGIVFEPHLLMMSATPIPQSLALTVFGDLDVSTIKTLPKGRKPIKTFLVKEGNEINAYEEVRKELIKGNQAYFVYPAIENEFFDNLEDSSTRKLKSAQENFIHLSNKIFPQYKCALVHSKISQEEQEVILRDFSEGKIQILAATTVIEVGVDVPKATCMVIEQADHFGMAQLHQLRGRVGRGSEQSFCFLIYSKNISQTGIERMKALRQSTDGFFIAEQDLKTRGPGEVNGTLQAGALDFKIADITKDNSVLLKTRQDILISLQK